VFDRFKVKLLLISTNFVGIRGGDIFDKNFINNEIIPTLVNLNDIFPLGKTGAILTFKKHLVSILQIPRPTGECWYDLIESLPKEGLGFHGYRARAYGVASLGIMIRFLDRLGSEICLTALIYLCFGFISPTPHQLHHTAKAK
jgi:hypothetical protein